MMRQNEESPHEGFMRGWNGDSQSAGAADDVSPVPADTEDAMKGGTKIAAALSADGFVKNSGYFDGASKPSPSAPISKGDSSVDDQIRSKKVEDRQRRGKEIDGDLKSIYRDPKVRERRVLERLKEEGL